jgi:hypothetical protein
MVVILLFLLALTSGVAVTLGLVIVGLWEAPWLVLLAILGIGLVGLQRLAAYATADGESSWATSGTPSSLDSEHPVVPESSTNDPSTLTYRGVKYCSPSPATPDPLKLHTDEGTTVTEGIYRGKPWRRTHVDASEPTPPGAESLTEMKYRGHTVKK